jgi:hypothetical protein
MEHGGLVPGWKGWSAWGGGQRNRESIIQNDGTNVETGSSRCWRSVGARLGDASLEAYGRRTRGTFAARMNHTKQLIM